MRSPVTNPWFWVPRPRAGPRLRLVCFPHAGGSASVFGPLARALPSDIELWAVQLPGRAARHQEPAPETLGGLVSDVAAALRSQLGTGVPYALLGQSFGGLLACQVARALQPALPPLAVLPVSVCPPHLWPWPQPRLTPEDVLGPAGYDGLPADPEVRRSLLDALGTDLRLLRQFHGVTEPILTSPVHAIVGTEDTEISWSEMAEWRFCTESAFVLEQLPAPHLLVESHAHEVSREVAGLLIT